MKFEDSLALVMGAPLVLFFIVLGILGPLGAISEINSDNSAEYPSSYVAYKNRPKVIIPPDDKEQALKEIEQDKLTAKENGDEQQVAIIEAIQEAYFRDNKTVAPLTKEQIEAMELYYPHGVVFYFTGKEKDGKMMYGLLPGTNSQAAVASRYDSFAPKISNVNIPNKLTDRFDYSISFDSEYKYCFKHDEYHSHNDRKEVPYLESAKTLSLRKVIFVNCSGDIVYARNFDVPPTQQTETDKQIENGTFRY